MKYDFLKIEDEVVRIVTTPYCMYVHSGLRTKSGGFVKCGLFPSALKDYCCPFCNCGNNGASGRSTFPVAKIFIVVVISRRDGKPYLYKMPTAVFTQIQKLFKDPRWGSPENYDLHIRKTEDPYMQYLVTTKPPVPLTDQDLAIKNGVDLEWLKEMTAAPNYIRGIVPEYEVKFK